MIICTLVLMMGFFALVKGADWFVNGSSALAENFHVPNLIIGLTIVALGTSAPELAVSTSAALLGANEIALSNVVGSNIFNLLGVLGICAMIYPLPVDKGVIKRDFPFSIITTGLLLIIISGPVFLSRQFMLHHMEQKIGIVTRNCGHRDVSSGTGYLYCRGKKRRNRSCNWECYWIKYLQSSLYIRTFCADSSNRGKYGICFRHGNTFRD